jgi:hypothetical protein
MRRLILLVVAIAAAAYGQCSRMVPDPATGKLQCVVIISSLAGGCAGTITSNTTVVLFGFQYASALCNSTTSHQGIPVRAGIVRNLRVYTKTQSGTVGSGVVTVYKNGSGTTVTCTLGTAASCSDSTHSFSVADGDRLTVKVQSTAASGDTLGDVNATIEVW